MTKITLDYPPSTNRYWRHDRGVTHRSQEANDYRDYVRLICLSAGVEPVEGDIAIRLDIFRPIRRGDLDNRIKVLLDALQSYAYRDDGQIAELHAYRHDDKQNPRVVVEVKAL